LRELLWLVIYPAMAPINKKNKSPSAPGEAAYDQLQDRLMGITANRVVQPRTDVRKAATFVLSTVAGRLKDANLRALFTSLPGTVFDHSALADLIPAAQLALWAQTKLAVDKASELPGRLPVELVDQSTALRTRMLELCTYHFKGDTSLGPQVEDIRAGSGYIDLAEDLSRLSTLYKTQQQILKQDLRFYKAADADEALALSQRITSELRLQPDSAKAARELGWRSWALLQELYEEVAQAGRFLLWRQDGETAFPSLHAVGRSRSHRRTSKPAPSAPQPGGSPAPSA
jgi:hypothetical protein